MLRFMDSFAHYSYAQIGRKWTAVNVGGQGTSTIQATAGRRSAPCLRIPDWNHPTWQTFDNQGTWIVGFAWKQASFIGGSQAKSWVGVQDAGSWQCCIRMNFDNTISACRGDAGGTVLATSTVTLAANVFDYIEVKFVIHNTTGSIVVKKNGTTILDTGAVNTRGVGTNNFGNRIVWYLGNGGSTSINLDHCDLYICDGQGSLNNDFLGDCRVDATFPNAEASNINLTPSTGSDNAAMVSDNPSNDDSNYNYTSTPGDYDLYDLPNIAPTAGTVKGVAVHITARKDDAGTRTIRDKIKSGATTANGTTVGIATTYAMYSQIHETDPNTSAAWSIANVNAAEFGVELVA